MNRACELTEVNMAVKSTKENMMKIRRLGFAWLVRGGNKKGSHISRLKH